MTMASNYYAGRPETYNDQLMKDSIEYIESFDLPQLEREGFSKNEAIPSIVGLCKAVGRGKTTIYNWLSDKDENKAPFRDICNALLELQELLLLSGGLVGGFNPQVAKMILTKHGYSDKQELDHTSTDGSMTPPVPQYKIVDE